MKLDDLRSTLSQVGVYADGPQHGNLELTLASKAKGLFSLQKKLIACSASDIPEAKSELKTSKKIKQQVEKILKSVEKHSSELNRASDAQKINNLHMLVKDSKSLLESHRQELTKRFEALDPVKQMRVEQEQLRRTEKRQVARDPSTTTMNDTQYAQMVKYATEGAGRTQPEQVTSVFTGDHAHPPKSQSELIQEVRASFIPNNSDEQRFASYLDFLGREMEKGSEVYFPKYYHCTKDNGLFAIASEGKVHVHTPRTGTGAGGAWVSTNPQMDYGKNIIALSPRLDTTHGTRLHDHVTPPVRNRTGGTNLGLQQHLYLRSDEASGGKSPLCFVGINEGSESADAQKASLARNLGDVLGFTHADGTADVAIFNTSTVLKIYEHITATQQPLIPNSHYV